MVGSVYTYALMKALYDEGRDYIDSFWPFAVRVIPSGTSVTSSSIQKSLKERFERAREAERDLRKSGTRTA